jgi:uncharacterized protein YnzC (UPF0291/DUF896 family)
MDQAIMLRQSVVYQIKNTISNVHIVSPIGNYTDVRVLKKRKLNIKHIFPVFE